MQNASGIQTRNEIVGESSSSKRLARARGPVFDVLLADRFAGRAEMDPSGTLLS